MPLPICCRCKCEMTVYKNGYWVAEADGSFGKQMVWSSDLIECPNCGHCIASNFGEGILMTPKEIRELGAVLLEFTR